MSLNKVILIGRLGRDPEVRYMPNGEAVCNFSLATSEKWKAKDGTSQERTEWHNISMFGRLAEIAGQYLKKGSQVYIEGRIQSRKYTDKTGVERTAYEIICSEMKMLDSKSSGGGGGQYAPEAPDYDAPAAPAYQNEPAAPPPAPRRRPEAAKPVVPVDDIDSDIPF